MKPGVAAIPFAELLARPPYRRLRVAGLLEAASWAALLTGSILKRTHQLADPLYVTGMLHGGLFVVYLLGIVDVTARQLWPQRRAVLLALIASVVPFGTLLFEWWLRRQARSAVVPFAPAIS